MWRLTFIVATSLALLAPAGVLAGCGDSASADAAPYLGTWQRVEAGEPNPSFTLTVAGREAGVDLTFANHDNGVSETVPATVEEGGLACVLPTGGDPAQASGAESSWPAAQGVPTESDLRLSLDENGRLVIDVVLADGTLEPIWIYERSSASAAGEP